MDAVGVTLQLVVFFRLIKIGYTTLEASNNGMSARSFHNVPQVIEVSCSGKGLQPGNDVFMIVLRELPSMHVLASVNTKSEKCLTFSSFSSCSVARGDSRRVGVKTLVMDMAVGEVRRFACNVTFASGVWESGVQTWTLNVRRNGTTTTVAPTTTTSTTTTIRPQPPSESPVASGVKSNVPEFQLPISVVIIGLVLLIFFAILCAILVILQCRGKRRRRSRAANRESLLSAKNEPMGEGGYRTPRNIPSYPPGHMPPETPGGNFAMRYQKSIPDTGYVSGSSVYYSEPYGTLDEEMKERLRPNPRMCHIPYDIKGGPLDTTHPQEHSA